MSLPHEATKLTNPRLTIDEFGLMREVYHAAFCAIRSRLA
jgi:hypothetical protein